MSDSYYVQTTEYDPDISYTDTNGQHSFEGSFETNIKYPVETLLKTDTENVGLSDLEDRSEKVSLIIDRNTAKNMYFQVVKNNQTGGGSKLSSLVGTMYVGNTSQKIFIDGYSKLEEIIVAHDLLGKNYKINVCDLSIN